jgi:hypothetical protein
VANNHFNEHNNGDLRPSKKGRSALFQSNEMFAPLEALPFDELYPSFYNTIDVSPENATLAWPDLMATYHAPPPLLPVGLPGVAAAASVQSLSLAASADRRPTAMETEDSSSAEVVVDVQPTGSEEDGAAHSHIQQLMNSEARYRQTLRQLYEHYNPGSALTQVQRVEEQLRGELSDIDQLLEQSVLKVEDLFNVLSLKDRVVNALNQASILESEEMYHSETGRKDVEAEPGQLVSFEWTDQPLGKSFKNKNRARATMKKKKGHVTMVARVVCAPGVKFTPSSSVKALFYQVEDDVKKPLGKGKKRAKATGKATTMHERAEELSEVQIQNNEESLSDGRVSFDFRFPAGTRNKPCLIRLHVTGTVTLPDGSSSGPVELVSAPSHRFIILTNEVQYETSELKLLMMDIFRTGSRTCSWPLFVNALNVRWMRVTRQEAESSIAAVPERTLSEEEMAFVASFFADAPRSVTREQVAAFYGFFGKATHHFRHNNAFRQLLMDGLVWGFMSKEQSEWRLGPCPVGTFLLRASESAAGSFCVSWKAPEGVRHALLDAKLLAPPMNKLAEYLCNKRFLQSLLQPYTVGPMGKVRQMVARRKEEAFRPFLPEAALSKTVAGGAMEGYLDLDLI